MFARSESNMLRFLQMIYSSTSYVGKFAYYSMHMKDIVFVYLSMYLLFILTRETAAFCVVSAQRKRKKYIYIWGALGTPFLGAPIGASSAETAPSAVLKKE